MIDMHFGTGPDDDDAIDPFLVDDHLSEIAACHKFSKSVFFIVSFTFNNRNDRRIKSSTSL